MDFLTAAMNIGAFVGASLAAYSARKAQVNTREVKTQMDGPADERSLRELVQHNSLATEKIREGVVAVGDRLQDLEKAVFMHLEDRIVALEDKNHDTKLLHISMTQLSENVQNLSAGLIRAKANIHRVANAAQVKLLTEEEAMHDHGTNSITG